MEAKLFRALYRFVHSVAHAPRRRREQYDDRWVALVFLWAALNDRPVSWACREENWPRELLDARPLPSASRMSRRLRTVGVLQLLERVIDALSTLAAVPAPAPAPPPLVKVIDSKPLCVGAYSKDRDAKRGRLANGQFARGYRLHAVTHAREVRHWTLLPMNEHDARAAVVLLPKLEGGGYAVADNAYDSNDNHRLAAAANHQLVAPPREVNRGVRDLRYNCPQRLRALDLLDSPLRACGLSGDFGQALYGFRQRVESGFGGLAMSGLDHLPTWVRGPRRVALWCAGKILLHLFRSARKQGLR